MDAAATSGASASVITGTRLPGLAWQSGIDQVRASIAARVQTVLAGAPYAGVIVAEAIGERQHIDAALWDRFAASGTSHLLVISGLHISMVAGLVGTLLGRLLPAIARGATVALARVAAGRWLERCIVI